MLLPHYYYYLLYLLGLGSAAHAATRRFAIEPQWGTGAPDGFTRPMILVNGTSPGPPLVVDEGDDVEVSGDHMPPHLFFYHINILTQQLVIVLRAQRTGSGHDHSFSWH